MKMKSPSLLTVRHLHHLHRLQLLQAVLLKVMLVDQIILAPMACAAVSGVIVVLQKRTVENAAKAIVMVSLLHLRHLVQAHPLQVLLQTILRRLLGSTIMLITVKIVVSLHTSGTGKIVPPMSKWMLIHTL
jgi:hypothetical protein